MVTREKLTGLRVASVSRVEALVRAGVPLYLWRVSAGFPSPASDYVEREIDLNEWLVGNRLATYVVMVEGDSMAGEIHSGDRLIVDRSLEARNGDVVACVGGEMLVRRLILEGGGHSLVAEDPRYPAIELGGDRELIIWGVVTHSIHRLR